MGAIVVAGVEAAVESDGPARRAGSSGLRLQLLGPMQVERDAVAIALPASRKVRALLAYLAVSPHAVARSQLCQLLWEIPDDPRAELRWCLSKIRGVIDEPARRRVEARDDAVRIDLSDCVVDAIEVVHAVEQGIESVAADRQRALCAMINGEFLEGLAIDRSPAFDGWLTAQRRRFRAFHVALLRQLVRNAVDDDALFADLDKWLALAPFDPQAHESLLSALARRGRIREGDEHVAATLRLFEAEGLDCTAVRRAWQAAKSQAAAVLRTRTDLPGIAAARGREDEVAPVPSAAGRRASIAVMPFADLSGAPDARGGIARALVHDVITRLAKLRSLFVIAQGTVFTLHERCIDPHEAGRLLGVDYIASGTVRERGERLIVEVELAQARTAHIVWAEVFDHSLDDAFVVLDEVGNKIVASIASEIETIERNRAVLRPPSSLDAWEAHHRGLWHMYRFNKADNELARHFFETAVHLDPTFARAYAGLSFTHFQNAFQGWVKGEPEIDRAFDAAGQSLMADDRDPAAHWAMGRALWLRSQLDQSVLELEQAIELSPNFALGHYTLAFVHSQAGDPHAAISLSDHSRQLSPYDPLLFAMLASRAIALVRLGRLEEAAEWSVKAAARPNAHALIHAIAAFCLALADRLDEARLHLATIYKTLPHYRIDDFLAAFKLAPDAQMLFRQAARRLGIG